MHRSRGRCESASAEQVASFGHRFGEGAVQWADANVRREAFEEDFDAGDGGRRLHGERRSDERERFRRSMEWSGRAGAKGFGAGFAVEDDANVAEALVASRGDGLKTVRKRGDTGTDGERRRTGVRVEGSGGSQRLRTERAYRVRRIGFAGRRADEKAPARCAGSFESFQPRGSEAASYRAVRPCANEAHDAKGGGALVVRRIRLDGEEEVVAPADLNASGDARAENAGDSFELFDTSTGVVAEEDGSGGAATRLAG